ncbi:putative phosphatase [Gordonia effusa NBRC 100432]|uniref:Putative phosphatase n=1 Tax=Gordonia effusa NBRC 100432 TaxID=1077974 RepID=H0R5X4_9ACTN|nr:histidine phosphatase family protein [Gordonia effusa]GAB20475.1 putative phosphatase [Gordonia effusa NBRC 100432]
MESRTGRRILLIRHGQTEWALSGRHTGRTDIDLTPIGEAAARALGPKIARHGLDHPLVICSPRLRALRTAELAGLSVDEVTESVAEWDYGDYEGLTRLHIQAELEPSWTIWTHGAPGGESLSDMTSRVDATITRITKALVERDVIVVSHGHFSRSFIARFLGQPIGFGACLTFSPAGTALLSDAEPNRTLDELSG